MIFEFVEDWYLNNPIIDVLHTKYCCFETAFKDTICPTPRYEPGLFKQRALLSILSGFISCCLGINISVTLPDM